MILDDEEWFNKIQESNAADQEEVAGTSGTVTTETTDDTPNIIYREGEEDEDEDEEKSKKRSWKRKRSKKFKEAVIKQKPVFNPDEGPFERYFDEYYKLDCEDVVGDVKCRFGYRKTEACSYGLTVDECIHCQSFGLTQFSLLSSILRADDKELNQWYSFKKMMKYRSRDQESRDLRKFGNSKRNDFMKRQILTSLYEEVKPEPVQIENLPAVPSSDAATESEPRRRHCLFFFFFAFLQLHEGTTTGDVVVKNSKKRKSAAAGKGALSEARSV
eukprot:sb/3468096/